MSYFNLGSIPQFRLRGDSMKTSRRVDAGAHEGVQTFTGNDFDDTEDENAYAEEEDDDLFLSRISTNTSRTIATRPSSRSRLTPKTSFDSDTDTDVEADFAETQLKVASSEETAVERALGPKRRLRDTLRRMLHGQRSFPFGFSGEKEHKPENVRDDEDEGMDQELHESTEGIPRRRYVSEGMFMLDDGRGDPPVMLAKKILDHIPGFSSDDEQAQNEISASGSEGSPCEEYWGLRSGRYSPECFMEKEERSIQPHTPLTPPPLRFRQRLEKLDRRNN